MKKTCFAMILSLFILFGFLSPAQSGYTGTYMFTEAGNDSNYGIEALEAAINDWFETQNIGRVIDLSEYSKIDINEADQSPSSNSFMTVTYADDQLSGTWSTMEPVEFYSVKGGNEFALYWLGELGLSAGFWSTDHLSNNGENIPTISHLSTWNPLDTPPNANVPEPTTLMLLGFGLIGLAGVGRRAMKK